MDILKTILPAEKPEPDLFVLTLNALKQIETNDEFFVLSNFIIKFVEFCGMTLDFDFDKFVYLDRTTGEFVSKQNFVTMQIDKKVFEFLKAANAGTQIDASNTTKKQALRLLNTVLLIKFNAEIRSFEFI